MLKITSLGDFDSPPLNDEATVGLIASKPLFCDKNRLHEETQPFAMYTRDYPDVNITTEMLATRESSRTIGASDLFLPVEDSAFKKIASIWRDKGFLEACRAAAVEDPQQISKIVHWLATRVTWMLDLVERRTSLYEALPLLGSGSVADIAATRDWTTALVRCLAWHPHCTRLAVATRDDRIRIFSKGIQSVAVLRHSGQKSVCAMNWRPNAGRELAAACHGGVLVWTIELGAASNSLSHATFLKHRNHAPVTSVAWHPQGDILVSCSPSDLNMIVWDVAKEIGVPLKRVGGGGLCFARWSPCGMKLLAATCRTVFRVWNIGIGGPWDADRWTVPNGRVAAACFGPNQMLLFVSTEDPATVFSLPLQENIFDVKKTASIDGAKMAYPVIDLNRVTFDTNLLINEDVTVGGRVTSMDWDPSGKYLAILFQDCPYVAIFMTNIEPNSRLTEIKPGCLVKGFQHEVPNCMQFHQNYDSKLAATCLTIAWSSGRVQQFPIVGKGEIPSDYSRSLGTIASPFARRNDLHNTSVSNYRSYR
ncbi:aladin [Venturia canescens]|uniref:aladin n=1 Tax=Venturia canescens TaxID=32260 RepID=UPI001C9CC1BF|nr:aladin [Venturia canescens]